MAPDNGAQGSPRCCDDTLVLVIGDWSWSRRGYFGGVDRLRLAGEELGVVRAALAEFIGLELTDVWYKFGRIFEFGSMIPFVNRHGEEVTQAERYVKAILGYEILGLGEPLTHENFADENRTWSELANIFHARVESDMPTAVSVTVNEFGEIKIALSNGFSIRVWGLDEMTDGENEVWHMRCRDTSFFLHGRGLNFDPVRKPS
jgi:hypothetical protein